MAHPPHHARAPKRSERLRFSTQSFRILRIILDMRAQHFHRDLHAVCQIRRAMDDPMTSTSKLFMELVTVIECFAFHRISIGNVPWSSQRAYSLVATSFGRRLFARRVQAMLRKVR